MSHKTSEELVSQLEELEIQLDEMKGKEHDQVEAREAIPDLLSQLKTLLIDETTPELTMSVLTRDRFPECVLGLIEKFRFFDQRVKKDIAQIFNHILERRVNVRSPIADYIETRPNFLVLLISRYGNPDDALIYGMMLHQCLQIEPLAKIIFNEADLVFQFFKYFEISTSDIAFDAFSTFKEVMTRHKLLCGTFLDKNYDKFFDHYQKLFDLDNHAIRTQALKLLGELLVDRHNFTTMTRYISNPSNLKLMMNMLTENNRNIQYEAFNVFKVFVGNPNKPRPILEILLQNQGKLVDTLSKFNTDRSEDLVFNEEKAFVIEQMKELKPFEEQQ